jgi:hypothetical protein
MRRSLFFGLALAGMGAPVAALAQQDDDWVIPPPADEITVRGGPLPICEIRPGDPLDALRETAPSDRQQWVDPNYGYPRLVDDPSPATGPDIWQRAGLGLTNFTFRAPDDDSPLCMGNHSGSRGYAQLRRVLDARRQVGRYARFTAFISAPPGTDVRVWITGGNGAQFLVGDYQGRKLNATGRWEPVDVTVGPIPRGVSKLSYGFMLVGKGDAWMTDARLEFIAEPPPDAGGR